MGAKGSSASRDRELLRRLEKAGYRRREVLTEEKVREIRLTYIRNHRKYGLPALSRKFGVSIGTLWKIVHGKTWKHVQ